MQNHRIFTSNKTLLIRFMVAHRDSPRTQGVHRTRQISQLNSIPARHQTSQHFCSPTMLCHQSVWRKSSAQKWEECVPECELKEILSDISIHALLSGISGVGKTAFIENVISAYDNQHTSLTINLLSRKTSNKPHEMIENAFKIRIKNFYAPIGGKKLSVFINDFNMFDSQTPLELLC